MYEVHERLPVSDERGHRYPLFGAVVPCSFRSELDAGHAGFQPSGDVGRAVAAYGDALRLAAAAGGLCKQDDVGVRARDDHGVAAEDDLDRRVWDCLDLMEDRVGVLAGQEADVD